MNHEQFVKAIYPTAYVTTYPKYNSIFYVFGMGITTVSKTPEGAWEKAAEWINRKIIEKLES